MSADRDIRETVRDAWHAAYAVGRRPELSDVERERIKIAAEILFEATFMVQKRFATAEPGTTTFSVLAQ
jgi:hypothetical protein